MSKIGTYEFTTSCEFQLVSSLGESCPAAESEGGGSEVDIEVECVLHCDDPEDGVYGEITRAVIVGLDLELSEEAIAFLDLSVEAGTNFMDSGVVHPKAGERYMDVDDVVWEVEASAMHHERAHDYTMLRRRIPFGSAWLRSDGWRRCVVETAELVHAPLIKEEDKLLWRRVVEEDEPGDGEWRDPTAVYVGKPKEGDPR